MMVDQPYGDLTWPTVKYDFEYKLNILYPGKNTIKPDKMSRF